VEQSPVSIVVTDRSGNIEYVNPKFTEVSGYAPEAVLGRNPRILSSGEMPQDRYREMWRTITSGNEWHGEFHNRKENGELHWEMASISPIFDAEGQITHFVAVKEDITERKRLEEELRQAQKMKAFGQLAGGVAHDFNNVLTVIQGNASLAQGSPPGSHAQAVALEEVIVAVARASDLTRQLLMFSRRQAVQLRDLDLNEVVGRMTRMLTRLIGEHIGLVAHYAPLGAPVHADAGMLEQVLMNLAVNSRDAMPQGGQLDIRTERVELGPDAPHAVSRRRPGSFVRLSVSDSGAGIAPDLVPRIFEPFFTTKDVGQGTGLGLATVFGIVEQHNGWIEVESRVGAGTDFHVYLPRLDGEAPASGRRPEEAGDDLGTETILLVEDEAAVRSLVSHVLTRRGYTVLEAASGPEALAMWTAHRAEIDLLLTDMVMPAGMSGRELAANLRADRPRLKVLFSSGYTDEMLEGDSSLRDGANFIGKPYATAELARKVRACLDAG
jgi:PAS domain S-box-containing protein